MQLGLFKTVDHQTKQFQLVPVINDRRFSHTWVIGKTGVGKSTALLRWVLDDIANGEGVAVIDPHGDLAEAIIERIPRRRRADVVLFNPAEQAFAFNIFDTIPDDRKAFVASSLTDSFKAIWGYEDMPTPALEQFLFNGARAMMDVPDGTLFGLKFLLTSQNYRKRVISHVRDPVIADFWNTDFAEHMPEREQRERTLSTLNKIGALIADPAIRNCIAQPRSKIDFRTIMNERKIFIAALPQGRLGIDKSALIGSLLLAQIQFAALSRTDNRNGFHLYIDECHHFAPGTLATMLSGIRKYGVSMVLSHQYLGQLPDKLKAAIMGTVGTTVAFRIGVLDAELIEPEFRLTNDDHSLCELPPHESYVRMGDTTTRLFMPETRHAILPGAAAKIRRHAQSQSGFDADAFDRKISRFVASASEEDVSDTRQRRKPGW